MQNARLECHKKRIDDLDTLVSWRDVLASVQDNPNLDEVVNTYMRPLESKDPTKKAELTAKLHGLLRGSMSSRIARIVVKYSVAEDFHVYLTWAALRDKLHEDKPRNVTSKFVKNDAGAFGVQKGDVLTVIGEYDVFIFAQNKDSVVYDCCVQTTFQTCNKVLVIRALPPHQALVQTKQALYQGLGRP